MGEKRNRKVCVAIKCHSYLEYLLKHILRLCRTVGVQAAHGMLGLLGGATLSKLLADWDEHRCQVREHFTCREGQRSVQ